MIVNGAGRTIPVRWIAEQWMMRSRRLSRTEEVPA